MILLCLGSVFSRSFNLFLDDAEMANNYFQFKQFKIVQEKSAMKVGTDGVLLGAWANAEKAKTILDIGAGTGLISLMLAQRSMASIVGVEIESEAADEACENVSNSPWKNRVGIQNTSFQEFQKTTTAFFDLIVSNPPFFAQSFKSTKLQRNMARHNDTLPFDVLISGVEKLLSENGIFSVILPFDVSEVFEKMAKLNQLHLIRKTSVKSNALSKPHRCLLEFSKRKHSLKTDVLEIYTSTDSDYTKEYKELTREFYLNF